MILHFRGHMHHLVALDMLAMERPGCTLAAYSSAPSHQRRHQATHREGCQMVKIQRDSPRLMRYLPSRSDVLINMEMGRFSARFPWPESCFLSFLAATWSRIRKTRARQLGGILRTSVAIYGGWIGGSDWKRIGGPGHGQCMIRVCQMDAGAVGM